jgi:hypothetical protein
MHSQVELGGSLEGVVDELVDDVLRELLLWLQDELPSEGTLCQSPEAFDTHPGT